MCTVVETGGVPRRSLSDPQSMAGATAAEVLALKPPGWLVWPLPGGAAGFRMISPGKMPGSLGVITVHTGGSSGVLSFSARPEPWLFVLNGAAEMQMLVEILAAWALPAESPGAAVPDIPVLAGAARAACPRRPGPLLP